MEMKQLLASWARERGWSTPVKEVDAGEFELDIRLDHGGQSFLLFVNASATTRWIKLFLVPPFRARPEKTLDVLRLANHIHGNTYFGRLTVLDRGEVQYKQVLALGNVAPDTSVLEKMYASGITLFDHWADELAMLALTPATFEDWQAGAEAAEEALAEA